MRSTMAGTDGACHVCSASPTVTYTGAECATLLFEPTARAATAACGRAESMLDLDEAGTIGGRDDLPVNHQLQTLQLIEVRVDVGLRTQP